MKTAGVRLTRLNNILLTSMNMPFGTRCICNPGEVAEAMNILYSYEAMNILFYWLKWGQIAFGDLSVWHWHGSQPGTRQKPQKRNPRSIFPLYSGLRLQAWKKLISEEKVVQSSKSQKTGRDFPDHSTVHDATFLMISWAEKIHSQVIRLALTKWLIWVVWAVSLMFKMSQACVCYNSYLEHSQ